MSAIRPSLRFHPDWKSALSVVLMLPILLSLGSWQLRRADEKARLLAAAEALRASASVDVLGLREFPNYLPVWVSGEFDPDRYWLMDNRIFQGQFGYEIIATLKLPDGRELLVDRGWIKGSPDRSILPDVVIPAGMVRLSGELYRGVGKHYSPSAYEVAPGWPRRQQWLDLEEAVREFPALLPTVLRLDEASPAALRVQRVVVNVSPQKHIGYAVQWFGMACVVFVIFIFRNSNLWAWLRREVDVSN